MPEVGKAGLPVGLVGRVEAEVGDMRGVQAGEALHLVPKAAVLVPCLQQLPPHRMEALMVVLKQLAVPIPHLHPIASFETSQDCDGTSQMHREHMTSLEACKERPLPT